MVDDARAARAAEVDRRMRRRLDRYPGFAGRRDEDRAKDDRWQVEPVPQSSWLLIRYDAADAGLRPVANGDVFWESPDIWIVGGDANGNAVAGKPTTVYARVWNLGAFPAVPTRVDFAFVDPSLGIPWSAPQLIGTAYVAVDSLATATVQCPIPWVPGPTGSTHACLMVMVSCPLMNDTPSVPWSASQDRHVAQHNLEIVAAQPGQVLSFDFLLTAVSASRTHVRLAAAATWRGGARRPEALVIEPGMLERAIGALDRKEWTPNARAGAHRASLLVRNAAGNRPNPLTPDEVHDAIRLEQVEAQPRVRTGAFVVAEGQPELLTGYADLGEMLELDSLERRMVTVSVRVPEPPPGEHRLYVRVAQVEDGVTTGGYTVVVDTGSREPELTERQKEDDVAQGDRGSKKREHDEDASAKRSHDEDAFTVVDEVVEQLSPLLPIRGLADLMDRMPDQGLKIRGGRLPIVTLEGALPQDVFPILSVEDLTRKVEAVLRVAVGQLERGDVKFRSPELRELADRLGSVRPAASTAIPAGTFAGPSLFGGERARREG